MKVMVLGATGATGRHVVKELLGRNMEVITPVRSADRLMEALHESADGSRLLILEETVLDMAPSRLESMLADCSAVVSCLGHNLSFKGMYGRPRQLVTDSLRAVCEAALQVRSVRPEGSESPFRVVLMNTTGNRNPFEDGRRGPGEALVTGLVRLLLPPHRDNEAAAAYLSEEIGSGRSSMEWVAVRPDSLIDEEEAGDYAVAASPCRSPIFDAGKTSRTNVARFMAELVTNDIVWEEWKGRMPVVYNSDYLEAAS